MKGLEHVDKVVSIDQAPIGRTPRSNAATYIPACFHFCASSTRRSPKRARAVTNPDASRSTSKVDAAKLAKATRLRVEMHFLPDIFVTCDTCGGRRYNRETLEILYRGMSIADALDLTVEQAQTAFEAIPRVRERLDALRRVGLGYLSLGQPATTLSGGEAQRVKLARELARKATGQTLYVLDEPTTGLHFTDIEAFFSRSSIFAIKETRCSSSSTTSTSSRARIG